MAAGQRLESTELRKPYMYLNHLHGALVQGCVAPRGEEQVEPERLQGQAARWSSRNSLGKVE